MCATISKTLRRFFTQWPGVDCGEHERVPVLPRSTGYTGFMPSKAPKPPALPPSVTRPDEGDGSVVAEKKAARTKPPRMYQVVMLNDDFTPMEFVVMVLQEYFRLDLEAATLIMLKIHHEGRAVCGVFSKDVAATKVELVLAAARRSGHPLQCIMEAA
jgi:ATP-dependent Clp protease adaptor protein ClpS